MALGLTLASFAAAVVVSVLRVRSMYSKTCHRAGCASSNAWSTRRRRDGSINGRRGMPDRHPSDDQVRVQVLQSVDNRRL